MFDSIQKVLELSGFSELNPAQRAAVDAGLLNDKNLVVAAPTASGKTLIAEIAALDTIKKGRKVVYIVPLRALATEKYEEFREKYESLGIKVAISIGDFDASDNWLGSQDIIIVTSEKLDSLLRHGTPWINMVGLLVVDEIHLLDSADRGPTLEVVLTRLRQVCNPKILGLSATINNYQDLAKWLDANSVRSDYRPVKLTKGICFGSKIEFNSGEVFEFESLQDELDFIIRDTMSKNKQALVFVSTRKSTESTAERVGSVLRTGLFGLNPTSKEQLNEIAKEIESALENPTDQCLRLANCIRAGSAFHHAGLVNKQRKIIEDAFRKGLVKVVSCTPTLAAGLNLPAYRVVIKDLKRFSSFKGMDFLPNLEIEQMCGRAGRPKYDDKGEAILVPKNQRESVYALENYINGQTENIYSKLGVEPVLRTHILALIASGVVTNKQELENFFKKTFYAHQFKDFDQLKIKLDKMLNLLVKFGFVSTDQESDDSPFKRANSLTEEKKLEPTKIGKRVSELYIDPITANYLIKVFERVKTDGVSWFGMLHIMARCMEARPLISAKKKDAEILNEILAKEMDGLIDKMPNEWDVEYEDYMDSVKTATVFYYWINEMGEDKILEELSVTPGELRARLDILDWLLYSSTELALLLNHMDMLKNLKKLRVRVEYGIKEELLPLIKLKGIGRVRARQLHSAGLKDIGDLKKVHIESLQRLVGTKTAEKIKEQL